MNTANLSRMLTDAVYQAQDAVDRQLDATLARLPDNVRLRDELERTIDDVSDTAAQDALRRILRQFDANADEVRLTLAHVTVHSGFDPIRIVAKDIASGNL